jgi:hypothetical protein
MITEHVMFALPSEFTREQVVAGMHEVAPRWRSEKDLIRKTFIYDPASNQAGAFYLWTKRESAELAHDEVWRKSIRVKYGSEPVVRYFETPLVVDNVLGQTISS